MRCYLDSSALLKRAIPEPESADLAAFVSVLEAQGSVFLTSVVSQIEVSRSLRRAAAMGRVEKTRAEVDYRAVMAGIEVISMHSEVIDEARVIGSDLLRSLDAIHLATAYWAGADMVITYDIRLIEACMQAGVMTARPGVVDATLPRDWEWLGEPHDEVQPPDSIWGEDSGWMVVH